LLKEQSAKISGLERRLTKGGLGLVSGRNRLINSDFVVNQEGSVSGDNIPDNAYFLDGWKNTSGTATSIITWADVGGVRTLTIGTSDNSRNITQHVEQSSVPAGSYTLSWEGNALGTVYNEGGTEPTSVASPVTVALDGTANALIRFYGKSATVRNVKLELGTVATPYQPPTYDDNLRACMRYYQRFGGASNYQRFGLGLAVSATSTRIQIPLVVPLQHASPTVTYSALALYDSAIAAVTEVTFASAGKNLCLVNAYASGLTQYRSYELLANGDYGAFIAFDARL